MKNIITGFLKYLYISTTILFLVVAGAAMSILLIGVISKSSTYNLDSIVGKNLKLSKETHSETGKGSNSSDDLSNEYHQNKEKVEKDKWSFCVDCHGSVDHNKQKETRSFLNMHSQFISCELCHVSRQDPKDPLSEMGVGWVDLEEGKLVPNPDLSKGSWGSYGAKVIQLTGEKSSPVPLLLKEEKNFYMKLKASSLKPDSVQEEKNNKILHQNLLKEPLGCVKCHSTEDKFFPYLQLGYSQRRKDFLVNSEVVDLIHNLNAFYIPSIIQSRKESAAKSGTANP